MNERRLIMRLCTYESLSEYLTKGKNKNDRPAPEANNTRVLRINDVTVGIKLHNTVIIEYTKQGTIRLNTNGWKTVTTRERMNRFQDKFSIFSEKFIWFLVYEDTYLYKDGMTLFPNGDVMLPNGKIAKPFNKNDLKRMKSLKRKVNVYCDKFIDKFFNHQIPQPSGADCWHCCFFDSKTGKSWGDLSHNSNHILNHIQQKYFVPSLLNNAIQETEDVGTYNLAPIDKHNIAYCWKSNGWESQKLIFDDITRKRLKLILRRYISKRVGLGMT
jgi:hypothetical protein